MSDYPAGLRRPDREPARGEERVPDQSERRSCFHVGAVLSPDADDTAELVPVRQQRVQPLARPIVAGRRRGACLQPAPGYLPSRVVLTSAAG